MRRIRLQRIRQAIPVGIAARQRDRLGRILTECCWNRDRTIRLVLDDWDEYPAIYSAQVTRPGSCKSKAMAIATEFVRKKEAEGRKADLCRI